ncbi:MAG: FecR family protein [Filimonas sp.]|nr:FecR family protein [Filimonas sp.]
MEKREFLILIDKFLAGQASPEEERALFYYYQSFQQSQEWDTDVLGNVQDVEKHLLAKIHSGITDTSQPREAKIRRFSFVKYAAAAILLIAIAGFMMRDTINNWLHPVHMIVAATGATEHVMIRLPDSTAVWLEPQSKVTYPEHFRGSTREISLIGGAFFEVAHNAEMPFIIHTNLISTRVLGTSFNVQAYDASTATVTVMTGKVLVAAERKNKTATEKQVILTPDERAIFTSNSGSFFKEAYPGARDYAQRRFGKFIYKGVDVPDVISDIQHIFNTTVSVQGSLDNCTFYGDFNINQGIEKILNVLAVTINANYKKDPSGNGYILTGTGCQ